jgi:hypothetical protein
MRRFVYTLSAVACSLILANAVQAQHRGGGHAGHAGHAAARPHVGTARPHVGGTVHHSNVGTVRSVNFGGFKSTPYAGRNYSYSTRRANWGVRSWCAGCGCWCYWVPDADCYYYWYEPDQCYYPLSYCPSGRYDYVEP